MAKPTRADSSSPQDDAQAVSAEQTSDTLDAFAPLADNAFGLLEQQTNSNDASTASTGDNKGKAT